MRYDFIVELVKQLQPETIIEIGLAKGLTAKKMLNAAPNARYTGYDVFDTMDKEFHKIVSNGKQVLSKDMMQKKLGDRAHLVEGMTQDTLWAFPHTADFVFIDGDHRVEAIRGDYQAVKGSKVIVFDDYYLNNWKDIDTDVFGCNKVVKDMDFILSPEISHFPDLRLAVVCDEEYKEIVNGVFNE